ncbi:MAG: MmgE/PrpD family protein [Desulfovibrionaceae bacterium]
MYYSQQIAACLSGLTVEDLPQGTRLKASHCLMDYLAAAWNAQGHPLADTYVRLARTLAGPVGGDATVIGTGEAMSPAWAAFANAAQGHVTEVDDGHRASIMHIGTVVIPVVLALAEARGLSGAAMLEAVVCGYDVAIRAGECFGPEHYATFHTTATAGVFGAAAAAAKAMRLPPQGMAWALGHAGTQAAGLWQFLADGAVRAKPFHPAKAAHSGMVAAALAEAGVESAGAIFEGGKGFCAVASKHPDFGALIRDLGDWFKIDEVNFKGYPTCGQTHSMLDALAAIMAQNPFGAVDVREVEARVYQRAVDIAGIPAPATLEEAKFSNQFCMAFLLARGALTFENFTEDAVADPIIRGLMGRVRLVVDPEMDAGFPAARPCRITVRLRNGSDLSAANRFRRGDPESPMDTAAMENKFGQLTGHVMDGTQRRRILDWCLGMASMPGVEPWLFARIPS